MFCVLIAFARLLLFHAELKGYLTGLDLSKQMNVLTLPHGSVIIKSSAFIYSQRFSPAARGAGVVENIAIFDHCLALSRKAETIPKIQDMATVNLHAQRCKFE